MIRWNANAPRTTMFYHAGVGARDDELADKCVCETHRQIALSSKDNYSPGAKGGSAGDLLILQVPGTISRCKVGHLRRRVVRDGWGRKDAS